MQQVARSIARELAVVGAATGASAAAPGVGTGVAIAVTAGEMSVTITRTADVILTIGAIHRLTDASIEQRRAWVLSILLFGDTAAQGFTRLAGELGKGLGSKATAAIPTSSLRSLNRVLGRTIVTKYGTKRGAIALGRLFPFGIGAVIGGGANLVLTRAIARHANAFFADLPEALRQPASPLHRPAPGVEPAELDQLDTEDAAVHLDRSLTPLILDDERRFVCVHGESCRGSVKAAGYGFAAGQLSYVGARYDTAFPRVLVVSMQVGDADAPITMTQRAQQIAPRIGEIPGQRNPHMRGTTRALQVLHGLPLDREHLDDGTHVLDAYAMANSTLCSALPTGGTSRRGKPTATMLTNCATHLALTIGELAPTVIVTQGTDTADVLRQLADTIDTVTDTTSYIAIGGTASIWCAQSHPAACPPKSWSSIQPGSYFDNTVRPTLELARRLSNGT